MQLNLNIFGVFKSCALKDLRRNAGVAAKALYGKLSDNHCEATYKSLIEEVQEGWSPSLAFSPKTPLSHLKPLERRDKPYI